MAQKKKLNVKFLAKKFSRKVVVTAKGKKRVAAKKQIKSLPIKKPMLVLAIEAEAKRSPAFAQACRLQS